MSVMATYTASIGFSDGVWRVISRKSFQKGGATMACKTSKTPGQATKQDASQGKRSGTKTSTPSKSAKK